MATIAALDSDATLSEQEYASRIADYLKEMRVIRVEMKKNRSEIQRLQSSSQRKLERTWELLRDIETLL